MTEYIIPTNIDDRVLKRAAELLASGGLVAHPTDTSWHISCAASSPTGIETLKKLKSGAKSYLLTLFTADVSQISDYAEVNTSQYKIIRHLAPGPYVFVLGARKKLEKLTGMKRREVGVRLPSDPVSRALLSVLGAPFFSITAAKTMEDQGLWDIHFAEENLFECGWELEDIPEVDMILETSETLSKTLTTVIDLTGSEMNVIREGAGALDL